MLITRADMVLFVLVTYGIFCTKFSTQKYVLMDYSQFNLIYVGSLPIIRVDNLFKCGVLDLLDLNVN